MHNCHVGKLFGRVAVSAQFAGRHCIQDRHEPVGFYATSGVPVTVHLGKNDPRVVWFLKEPRSYTLLLKYAR